MVERDDVEASTTRRRRSEQRSTSEVRALLLGAAEELFSEHGYSRTSTKSIAARAGVAEVLLFRHFGGKANLFREAVYRPVVEALDGFVEEHVNVGLAMAAPDEAARALVSTLHGVLDDRRGAVVALSGARTYSSEVQAVLGGAENPLARLFLELERILLRYAVAEDYTGLHPPVTARSLVAVVVAFVVYRPWLISDEDADVGNDEVVDQITALLHYGVLHPSA